ncbi:uncharacterized protein LOC132556327 [Ylistrum balloti]|uniref:uncharacterized protein LOC132556327 n=1 Tax=Ylistrum balloti TaxID=509963 RepID=UPI002905CB35|nr:uncharacterized protein LOC132556327 [Ylistrum balloti]
MSGRICLLPFLVCLFCKVNGTISQQSDQPEQLMNFVASVDRKFKSMEHILTDKDVRVDQLETALENHMETFSKYVHDKEQEIEMAKNEISNLKQQVMLLTRQLSGTQKGSPDRLTLWEKNTAGRINDAENSQVHAEITSNDDYGKTSTDTISLVKNATCQGSIQNDRTFPDTMDTGATSDVADENRTGKKRGIRVVPPALQAFHLELTHSLTAGKGNIVKFDDETLDDGDGYNANDGIYTVPKTGTYVITWTTLSGFRSYIQTYLIVNGVRRGASFADAQEIHDVHQATGIVVLRLNQGDHLFIQVGRTTNNTVYSDINYSGRPTFSGWILF